MVVHILFARLLFSQWISRSGQAEPKGFHNHARDTTCSCQFPWSLSHQFPYSLSSINVLALCDLGGGRKVALGRGMKHKIIWACKDENFVSIANTRIRFEMV